MSLVIVHGADNNSPELYQLPVGQRDWTPQRYERFLVGTWHSILLPD
jgi:hypothetical protein